MSGRPAGEIADELRARATEEGFDAIGIARAEALDRDGAALAAWLRRDMQAAMAWMARDPSTRADPRRLLPGCRSVIALAMSYWHGAPEADAPAGAGRVALYARGRDYHRVMGSRLRRLATWLGAETGAPTRAFVDTGPVLERAWAERSSVGWIGKNANLISRRHGSWLLLGEILTAAALPADEGPHADHCGTCSACIEACPTGAIVEAGVVDSNRCISNWTIEHRGPVPRRAREGNGDWLFGCDVCQDVCPWNERFPTPRADDPFERRADLGALDPRELVAMGEAEFRRRYSGTPLMRARWDGMRRNACIVLGNRRDPAGVPALAAALGDDDPLVRGHAAWALGRIGGEEARVALSRAAGAETDPAVRGEIALARDAV